MVPEIVTKVIGAVLGLPPHTVAELTMNVQGVNGPTDLRRQLRRRLQLAPMNPAQRQALMREMDAKGPEIDGMPGDVAARCLAVLLARASAVPVLQRPPVDLGPMPDEQACAWKTLLAMSVTLLDVSWTLVGGQMVYLHCLEQGIEPQRVTIDGDIVVGVWTQRRSLRDVTGFLASHGFIERRDSNGYGYRWTNDRASIDVLLPEQIHRQRSRPRTIAGSESIEAAGGNQALIRTERVPVRLDEVTGEIPRPSLFGGLVAKCAAAGVDRRDTERHLGDIVLLGELLLARPDQLQDALRWATSHDRRRIRTAVERLPTHSSLWRAIGDPTAIRAVLLRLAQPA